MEKSQSSLIMLMFSIDSGRTGTAQRRTWASFSSAAGISSGAEETTAEEDGSGAGTGADAGLVRKATAPRTAKSAAAAGISQFFFFLGFEVKNFSHRRFMDSWKYSVLEVNPV